MSEEAKKKHHGLHGHPLHDGDHRQFLMHYGNPAPGFCSPAPGGPLGPQAPSDPSGGDGPPPGPSMPGPSNPGP